MCEDSITVKRHRSQQHWFESLGSTFSPSGQK
jgi:hypothetical protein